jgi:hypothetical protein
MVSSVRCIVDHNLVTDHYSVNMGEQSMMIMV